MGNNKNKKNKKKVMSHGGFKSNRGGVKAGGGRPLKIKNAADETTGFKGLSEVEKRKAIYDGVRKYRMKVTDPTPEKTKLEQDSEREIRLAERKKPKVIQDQPGASGDDALKPSAPQPQGAEIGPGPASDRDEEATESEDEDDYEEESQGSEDGEDDGEEEIGDTFDAEDPDEGPHEDAVAEIEDPLTPEEQEKLRAFEVFQQELGRARNKDMSKQLKEFYDRTRKGGKSYPLAVVYNENVEGHKDQREEVDGKGQHECPERTRQIFDLLTKEGIMEEAQWINEGRMPTREEMLSTHSAEHIETLESLSKMTKEERLKWCEENDGFTIFANEHTTEAALLSAGGVLQAIDHVMLWKGAYSKSSR